MVPTADFFTNWWSADFFTKFLFFIQNPIDISKSQMSKFTDLAKKNRILNKNYRPAQNLNDRVVYDMDATPQVCVIFY